MKERILSLLLTVISRFLLRHDRLSGRMSQMLDAFAFEEERLVISSGSRDLSAVFVSAGEHAPVFLVCHGVGELVEYWSGVQKLFRAMGFSSLVFDYSGYGASSGNVSAAHCEEDAVAVYGELVSRGHRSIFLLGFSLGSAVVSAVASRLEVDGVILCEGFSALRETGEPMGLPRWMTYLVPNVWETVRTVSELKVPLLVVHSDRDELFPLTMARRIVEACGERAELIVVPGLSHNAPIFAPTESYWGPVAEWAKKRSSSESSADELQVISSGAPASGEDEEGIQN